MVNNRLDNRILGLTMIDIEVNLRLLSYLPDYRILRITTPTVSKEPSTAM